MTLIQKAIKKLFPSGWAWRLLNKCLSLFIDGLAPEIDKLRLFLNTVKNESLPNTAIDTLPEWHDLLGVQYDPLKSISDQQDETAGKYAQVGGQDVVYILDVLTEAGFPDITITEQDMLDPGLEPCGVALCGEAVTFNFKYGGLDGTWPFIFIVGGFYPSNKTLQEIKNIIEFLRPGHTQAIYDLIQLINAELSNDGTNVFDGELSNDGTNVFDWEFGE